MVDRLSLSRRLDKLREVRLVLEKLRSIPPERLLDDPVQRGAAERYLELAAQCVIDMASHVLAERQLGVPDRYRDVFAKLAAAGEMSADLADRLAGWAGFRNVLVHGYVDLQGSEVYRALQEDLGDLDEAQSWAAGYLTEGR